MKDLVISYENENGERIYMGYNTINDFLDEMESDEIDIPMMNYANVVTRFFDNPKLDKVFPSINDLWKYCRMIVQ